MKHIIILVLFCISVACSEKDQGIQFSDKYNNELGKNAQAKVVKSEGCAFKEVDYKKSTDSYSLNTEKLITELLSSYVTPLEAQDSFEPSGQVNYSLWLASYTDKQKLCEVVDHFKNTDVSSLSGNDKKVFFINAYNILTIELILKNYLSLDKGPSRDRNEFPEQKSIKNINGLGVKVWDSFSWELGGQSYTLNQIEKGILIPMKDARIHFAINCASLGCPPLRNEAYTVERIDEQLDQMSTFFVSSPAYNIFELLDDEYDPENSENYYEVSSIFDWYAQDFVDDTSGRYGSVRAFIVYHLNTSDEDLGFPKVDLLNDKYWIEEFKFYEWNLNEVGI